MAQGLVVAVMVLPAGAERHTVVDVGRIVAAPDTLRVLLEVGGASLTPVDVVAPGAR